MTDEKLKALAAVAADVGRSTSGKSAFSELIYETVQPNRLSLEIFNAFLPTRQLNVGDVLVKRLNNYGLPVRTMVPGTNHLADQVKLPQETYTYQIDYLIAKIRYSLWELQRAELFTLADLTREMESSIIDELVQRVFTLIGTVWNASNTPNNFLSTSEITEAALETMIEHILLRAGNVRAIVGTRAALLPIYKFNGVFEHKTLADGTTSNPNAFGIQSILEEWKRTGRLTSFRGIPLIELPQIYKRSIDGYNTPLLKIDEVHVIGDNAGEIILYGGTERQEHVDTSTEPPEYSLAMWRGFGMVVDQPENVGIIKLTGTQPF